MRKITLIFFTTVIILLVGILFGYASVRAPDSISDSTRKLSEPFEGTIDSKFLEKIMPAL